MSLAQRRALQVRRELMKALEQKRRGMSSRVSIRARSRGERDPISTVAAENRRVKVCLSIKVLQPQRPPASRPQVPQPPSFRPRPPRQVPTTPIPSMPPITCNPAGTRQKCLKNAWNCGKDCGLKYLIGQLRSIPQLAPCVAALLSRNPQAIRSCVPAVARYAPQYIGRIISITRCLIKCLEEERKCLKSSRCP